MLFIISLQNLCVKIEYFKITIQCNKILIAFQLCFTDYTKQTGENEVQRITV